MLVDFSSILELQIIINSCNKRN